MKKMFVSVFLCSLAAYCFAVVITPARIYKMPAPAADSQPDADTISVPSVPAIDGGVPDAPALDRGVPEAPGYRRPISVPSVPAIDNGIPDSPALGHKTVIDKFIDNVRNCETVTVKVPASILISNKTKDVEVCKRAIDPIISEAIVKLNVPGTNADGTKSSPPAATTLWPDMWKSSEIWVATCTANSAEVKASDLNGKSSVQQLTSYVGLVALLTMIDKLSGSTFAVTPGHPDCTGSTRDTFAIGSVSKKKKILFGLITTNEKQTDTIIMRCCPLNRKP
ncbi:MAG: hypothetical protein FWF35_02635 [Elusimicrobia bacterium]|nr:hypothetical protein [Elusimicrobiota bacterium]